MIFRKITTKNDVDVAYSQGAHVAFVMTLAWLWVENRQLLKFAREQRLELEERVAALEAKPTLAYRGVWDGAKLYAPGTFITHGGSVWHSDVESRGVRPGEGNSIWRLAVKRGSK